MRSKGIELRTSSPELRQKRGTGTRDPEHWDRCFVELWLRPGDGSFYL